ncbi:MAG TPA: ATP-binding protein, partial [Patescibacteria group bacterium]|nr:ATP-binding protein [Patescibacteria group bacterium]
MAVFYQKYRPQRFADVIGQEAIVQTLRNAAQAGQLAHAYLFTGSRGVGKTTLARLLAKAA